MKIINEKFYDFFIAIKELFLEDIKKLNIYFGSIFLALVIIFFVPQKYIPSISEKIIKSDLIRIVFIFIFLFVGSFLFINLLLFINNFYKNKKRINVENNKLLLKLQCLNKDAWNILLLFYQIESNKFTNYIKLKFNYKGTEELLDKKILKRLEQPDFEGGYNINRIYTYMLEDKYFYFLNKLTSSKNNSFINKIKNDKIEKENFEKELLKKYNI